MVQRTFIYALKDPRDDSVRYVGKSDDPKRRLKEHINESRSRATCNYYKVQWIRGILRNSLKPVLIILEEVACSNWQEREAHWMAQFDTLTNLAEAGQGGNLGVEVCRRISETLTGRKRPGLWNTASRAKLSNTLKGRRLSAEHKEKISAALQGKKRPATDKVLAHVKKGNKSKTGQKLSEETKLKISQSQKRRHANENH